MMVGEVSNDKNRPVIQSKPDHLISIQTRYILVQPIVKIYVLGIWIASHVFEFQEKKAKAKKNSKQKLGIHWNKLPGSSGFLIS